MQADGDYNPFQYRNVKHPTTDLETLFHLLKGCLGSGILAMPMAFSNAGLVFGFFATFVIGIICTYCIHILVKSAHALCHRRKIPSLSFAEVAEVAFLTGPECLHRWSRFAKSTINFFLVIDLLGCCSVYTVLVAKSIKQVVELHYTESKVNLRIYMAALLPFFIPLNLIRSLKFLAPFSMIADILIGIGICFVFYYIFSDLPSPSERIMISDWSRWPMFFGSAIFALEGIGVVLPLENSMKTPTHMTGVAITGMSFVTVLYTTVGFFGFLKYGEQTLGSVSLNINETNKYDILAQGIVLIIAVAIFLTYLIQFYVPMEIIWKSITKKGPKSLGFEYGVRTAIVIATVLVAIAIPNLGEFISLVGAVCLSTLGLMFPAIIDLVVFYEDPGLGPFKWRLWKNSFLIIFGMVGFFTGSYVSIQDIVANYS